MNPDTLQHQLEKAQEQAIHAHEQLAEAESSNDELRQEAERLRSDAAYGRTAMDSYAVVQRERDRLREVLQELVDEQWPCDTDNLHVEVWCIAHQTKRCHMDEIVAVARAALTASPTMTNYARNAADWENKYRFAEARVAHLEGALRKILDSHGTFSEDWYKEWAYHSRRALTPQEDSDE